jgi:hypothetical protein
MELKIMIHDYDVAQGLLLSWQSGAQVRINIVDGEVILRANRSGFFSMAAHMLTLAQEGVPQGEHLHLDDSNGLEEGSCPVVIERI